MKKAFPFKWLSVLVALLGAIFWFLPWLFVKAVAWQQVFNQLTSENLHAIQQNPVSAGLILIGVSFLYGVLHALGPGHGKFIIAGYLSTHQSELKPSVKLSLLASLMQGVVAIVATSVIVVVLNLSSRYFKLSQLWLERGAWVLLLGLGIYWIYQGAGKPKKAFRIKSARFNAVPKLSAVKADHVFSAECSCGHQHLPNAVLLRHANTWRSQFFIILSIGLRPCSGAIFVLFLAYMSDLFLWGVFAVLAMSFGTGLTLSLFAVMVRYAKQMAIRLGRWYGGKTLNQYGGRAVKIFAGGVMIFFAASLLYGTTLEASGGAVLFGK